MSSADNFIKHAKNKIIANTKSQQFDTAVGRISQGLKNVFELAMVNEPSVFELSRFGCICLYTPLI